MWMRLLRIIAAVLVAPLATLGVVIVVLGVEALFSGRDAWEVLENYTLFAIYGLLIAYPVTLIVGVPTHLVLSYFRVGYVWAHALAGGVLVLVTTVIYFDLLDTVREEWSVLAIYLSLYVFSGAAVAGVFGAIAGTPKKPA